MRPVARVGRRVSKAQTGKRRSNTLKGSPIKVYDQTPAEAADKGEAIRK